MITIKIYGLVALIFLIFWLTIGIAEVTNNQDIEIPAIIITGYINLIISMFIIVLLGAGVIH